LSVPPSMDRRRSLARMPRSENAINFSNFVSRAASAVTRAIVMNDQSITQPILDPTSDSARPDRET